MKNFYLIILVLGYLFSTSLSAKVWINELMQSNIDLIRDDLQEFPDSWIELYNDSNEAVDIQNWTVSDDANYQRGWKITDSLIISPKSYLLIYADKASQGLHTHFHLDSGSGGAVYLFDESGRQIDAVVNIPKQPAPNIVRGRISDGNALWAYFVSATPGSENTGKISNVLLPPPVFSQKGGIFKDTVNVILSLPDGAPKEIVLSDIHYTLDNSEPNIDSPSYTDELRISKTTVLRAKLIHPDYLTDRSKVHSYIISEKKPTLPIISISLDSTYLWDEEFGIYCKGNGKYGLIGNGIDYPVNWNNDWRRPINFEYFPLESNTSVLNQLCEMRISGGWTRVNPQKSFIVYGNKRFGVKRFEYDLFKEKPNQEINSFMIRNSGNDFWFTHFRDAAIQLFMGGKVDIDYQAYQPAIFYLNGNFWGIQNLRERSEEDFVLANYATENVDVIENWAGEVKTGDRIAWDQLMNELRKSSSERNYQWITNQIDIDEFINYMILQIYVSNTDFPHNNMSMWRPRTTSGKWRFILKDLDFGLGIWDINPVTHNALEYNTESDDSSRKLFNALLTQDSFRKKFYSRFAIYMGDLLNYNSTSQIIDSIQKLLEPAMPDHIDRWLLEVGWGDINNWYNQVSKMKKWCEMRNAEVYKHLQDFFQLGPMTELTYGPATDFEMPPVFINDVRMRNQGLNSCYYFQKENLELHYEGDSPKYGWEIMRIINGATIYETYFQQNLSYQVMENCNFLRIRLIDKLNSLTSLQQPEINLSIFDSQLQISGLQRPSVVLIYDISGKLVKTTTSTDNSIIIPIRQKGVFIVKIMNDLQTITRKVLF